MSTDPPDIAAAVKALGDAFAHLGHVLSAQAALGAALRGDVNAARRAVEGLPDTVRADVATAAGVLATICTDATDAALGES